MKEGNGFIADGYERARAANEPIVRAEVESEYSAKLNGAAAADQRRIRRELEAEIRKRLDRRAPPNALY